VLLPSQHACSSSTSVTINTGPLPVHLNPHILLIGPHISVHYVFMTSLLVVQLARRMFASAKKWTVASCICIGWLHAYIIIMAARTNCSVLRQPSSDSIDRTVSCFSFRLGCLLSETATMPLMVPAALDLQ